MLVPFHARVRSLLMAALALTVVLAPARQGQTDKTPEAAIDSRMGKLRDMPDAERAVATRQLAMEIRKLPAGPHKLLRAEGLANLSTEGDFGIEALQAVADTLSRSLSEAPPASEQGGPAFGYLQLAQLERYEHVKVSLQAPDYTEAQRRIAALETARSKADFTLTDLEGKTWTRSSLKGKVVLVNFWATWCPPCRKEMPDLQALHERFKSRGLVILAISDEDAAKVKPFIAEHHFDYPVLLDPGRKVNELYQVDGIPKSFVYDRSGKLVAQAIDMRTMRQFLELLGRAGLKE